MLFFARICAILTYKARMIFDERIFVPLIFDVKVTPQSGRQGFVIDKSGILKCFLKATPEHGKANKELIEIIADACDVSKSCVEIITGLASRNKRIAVQTGLSYEQFLGKAGLAVQQKLF
jgi:uncharacterized protein YggU (UPF0235/DUF167 family)